MPERQNTIAIVIADKSPLVQTGLAGIFAKDERFTLLATAADGERFMQAVERLAFDIGIIGWDMPYMNGRQVIEALGETPAPPSATRASRPANHVRLIGYDNLKQTQGASMVIFRG